MGKALYRKHRSRKLDEVIGQDHITDTLKNALKKGAVSHAYLFTGPKGVGKTSVARILAHEINKLEYNDESIHLDIIEIDAASNRRIDEIRDLRDKAHIAPTSAKFKVYIIDEVHMLTREAFNALLKTLEEPPAHVVFILATTEAHKVPDTIISRTQRFTFKPIAQADVVNHLRNIAKKEKIQISDDALELIAEHGDGSLRDSISMLDQLSGLGKDKLTANDVTLLLGLPDDTIIAKIIDAISSNDTSKLFDSVRQLREQGVSSPQATKSLSTTIRNMLLENKLEIKRTVAIKLLQDMLSLTAGSDDFLGLELCLLDAMDADDASEKINTQKNETLKPKTEESVAPVKVKKDVGLKANSKIITAPKPSKQSAQKTALKATDKQTKSTTENFDLKTWNEFLEDIKGKHNTLYGVLRMAEPSIKDDVLQLSFSFGFHKKRCDEPKNCAKIKEFVNKHFGPMEFRSVVNSNKKTTAEPKKKVETKTDETVKSVSNIFKGAQLLES